MENLHYVKISVLRYCDGQREHLDAINRAVESVVRNCGYTDVPDLYDGCVLNQLTATNDFLYT